MERCVFLICLVVVGASAAATNSGDFVMYQPEQIRLSLATDPASAFVVTWTTWNATAKSRAQFGTEADSLDGGAAGDVEVFFEGGAERRRQFIHTVRLVGLEVRIASFRYTFSR